METVKNLVNEYMTGKQQETFKKLSLNSTKNADKIAKMLDVARTKQSKDQAKELSEKIKDLTLNSYDEFRGFYNVYNHIKKSLKASALTKHEAKILTQKFNATNVTSLLDFNTLLSLVNSGFNYGTKSHFSKLANAMIQYISLETVEQNEVNERSIKVNKLLQSVEAFSNIGELFDLCENDVINKASAKFIFEHDNYLFDMLCLNTIYNHEYEQGVKDARKKHGSIGVSEFIKEYEAKQAAPKVKKIQSADVAQLNA